MKKRLLGLIIVGVLILGMSAQAVNPRAGGMPLLSFSGTTANCSVTCRGDNATDRIYVTLSLYHGSALVDSWSASGTYRVPVSGSCGVERGETYRLVMNWSLNGVLQPTYETSATCP